MNINSIAPYQSTPFYSKSTNVKNENIEERVFSINETVANIKGSTSTQNSSSTVYKELSGKYDVRNATFEEITEISKALYEAGEISLKEHATLTFDFERATNNLKQNAPGVPSNFNMYETSADSNGRRDWIAEFGARASKNFKYGNLIGYQSNTKILDILQKLDNK